MAFWSTREVAKLLGVSVALLTKAAWSGRVDPPQKSPSGSFLWTEADIERASCILLRRPHASQKRSRGVTTTARDKAETVAVRSKAKAANRPPSAKSRRRRARLIPSRLRNWLWRLLDRAMKALFDALLDHSSG
jgi:hypothetical protein